MLPHTHVWCLSPAHNYPPYIGLKLYRFYLALLSTFRASVLRDLALILELILLEQSEFLPTEGITQTCRHFQWQLVMFKILCLC